MARPIGGRLSEAFKATYMDAGLTQLDIVAGLHARGFANVDQPLVSKWSRGMRPIQIEALPHLDAICGKPTGHILWAAGYVDPYALAGVDVFRVNRDDPDEVALWALDTYPPAERIKMILALRAEKSDSEAQSA